MLRLGFASDDVDLILGNTLTGSWSNLPRLFTQDLWGASTAGAGQTGYWRPLLGLSLMLDRGLWGLSPLGHHLQSLVWHVVGALGLWRWARARAGAWPALVAALVYGLHPLQTESVAFVSARNDLLAAAGVAWAGALWAGAGRGALVGGAAALLLGCLAKESAVPAALILPFLGPGAPQARIAASAVVLAAWASLRFGLGPPGGHLAEGLALGLRDGPAILAHYMQLLFVPHPLSDSYTTIYHLPTGLSLVGALGAAAVGAGALLRWGRRGAALGLGLAVLTAGPALAAMAPYHLMGDRYATLPLLGLGLALAAALPDRRGVLAPLGVLLPIWLVIVGLRIPDWDSSLSLAEAAVADTPSPYSHGWLGKERLRAGQPEAALPELLAALEGDPPFCLFALEAVEAGIVQGQGVSAGQAVYDAGCAGVAGVRAAWAEAHLREGQPERADRIMTPRPACDPGSAAVLAALAARSGEAFDLAACAAAAGITAARLREEAGRLGGGGL